MAGTRGTYKRRKTAPSPDVNHGRIIQDYEDWDEGQVELRVRIAKGRIRQAPSIRRAPPDPGAEAQAKRIADWIEAHA